MKPKIVFHFWDSPIPLLGIARSTLSSPHLQIIQGLGRLPHPPPICYYFHSMQIAPCNWSLWRAIVSIGVVGSLCFSIGEGLRLAPFPVVDATETETSDDSDTSVRKYGPIDVPTRTKNRKRQFVDYAYSAPERGFSDHRSIASERHERIDVPSSPLGSHPQGRAPPAC